MRPKVKKIIKNLVPPAALDFYFNLITPYGFRGEYQDWRAAEDRASGYDSDIILNKTKDAALKVKNGEAAYERDSFLFDKIQYSWPLLAFLLHIAAANDNRLNLLDFGGALGSSYYQNRHFLSPLRELIWNVIEQPSVVACGRQNFADSHLRFYNAVDDCLSENSPSVALCSASLQYLPEPYNILGELFRKNIKYLIIDRLTVNDRRDLITIQKVDPVIYEASYPLWIFREKNILDYFLKNGYELIVDFDALGGEFLIKKTFIRGRHKGYLFKLKDRLV